MQPDRPADVRTQPVECIVSGQPYDKADVICIFTDALAKIHDMTIGVLSPFDQGHVDGYLRTSNRRGDIEGVADRIAKCMAAGHSVYFSLSPIGPCGGRCLVIIVVSIDKADIIFMQPNTNLALVMHRMRRFVSSLPRASEKAITEIWATNVYDSALNSIYQASGSEMSEITSTGGVDHMWGPRESIDATIEARCRRLRAQCRDCNGFFCIAGNMRCIDTSRIYNNKHMSAFACSTEQYMSVGYNVGNALDLAPDVCYMSDVAGVVSGRCGPCASASKPSGTVTDTGVASNVNTHGKDIGDLARARILVAGIEEKINGALRVVTDAEKKASDAVRRAEKQITDAEKKASDAVRRTAKQITDAEEKATEAVDQAAEAVRQAEEDKGKATEAVDQAAEAIRQAEEDKGKATEAVDQAADAIRQAEEDKGKATEAVDQAAEAIRQAEEDEEKATEAVDQAAEAIRQAEEDEEKATETEKKAAEAVRKADEEIAEAEKKAAEAVRKADEEIAEAEKKAAEAVRQGDEEIAEAEKKAAEAVRQADEDKGKATEAEKKAAEAVRKADEEIAEAEKKAAEAVRKADEEIAEAEKKASEAVRKADEKIVGAQSAATKAEKEAAEVVSTTSILAGQVSSLQDINTKIVQATSDVKNASDANRLLEQELKQQTMRGNTLRATRVSVDADNATYQADLEEAKELHQLLYNNDLKTSKETAAIEKQAQVCSAHHLEKLSKLTKTSAELKLKQQRERVIVRQLSDDLALGKRKRESDTDRLEEGILHREETIRSHDQEVADSQRTNADELAELRDEQNKVEKRIREKCLTQQRDRVEMEKRHMKEMAERTKVVTIGLEATRVVEAIEQDFRPIGLDVLADTVAYASV